MEEILRRNQIADFDDVISAVFTTTSDLNSAFPAEAARAMGMNFVPLLCARKSLSLAPCPGACEFSSTSIPIARPAISNTSTSTTLRNSAPISAALSKKATP
ncbi:MAG UNVERIFIED_CONTAM: chorismate mutase [Planctomycetaceae bacterium]